jgi:hypothetical protein
MMYFIYNGSPTLQPIGTPLALPEMTLTLPCAIGELGQENGRKGPGRRPVFDNGPLLSSSMRFSGSF